MYTESRVIGLYGETPLHPGSGSTAGAVDLPVQRERHTGYPLIPGTSLKGVLRDLAEHRGKKSEVTRNFGPEPDGGGELHAGALTFTDARLLAFPVRSLEGVFVWVTCPWILARLNRDLATVGADALGQWPRPDRLHAVRGATSALRERLVLEEYDYDWDDDAEGRAAVDKVATLAADLVPRSDAFKPYVERLKTHLVLLSDDDFRHLAATTTEVVTRIKLNARKTTTGDGGNMWVEEFLPSDCLFYALALASPPRNGDGGDAAAVMKSFVDLVAVNDLVQIGGSETVGRGWMRVSVYAGPKGTTTEARR